MGKWTGNTPRNIVTFKTENRGKTVTFPRGAFWRVVDVLSEYGVKYKVRDNRTVGDSVHFEFNTSNGFEWRPYQLEAIDRILDAETCLLEGGPASGKTEILLGAIARAGLRTAVIVPSGELLDQWVERIHDRLQIPMNEIGIIGGGKDKLGSRITVMMQRSALSRIEKLRSLFGFVCLDEAHHAAASTFLELLDQFDAKYRIGASATIERQDLKHFLTHDLFGEKAFSISRDDLKRMGYTAAVTLHIVHTDFRYDYLNEGALEEYCSKIRMDYEDLSAYEKEKLAKKIGLDPRGYPEYLTAVSKNTKRNNLIYKYLKKEYDAGKKCAVFTKRRAHCIRWKKSLEKVGIEVIILWRGKNARDKRRVKRDLQRLKSGKVRIGIGTTIDEGVDMPAVKAGFISYRNAKNRGQLVQQVGRLERLFKGGQAADLYYFHDARIQRFADDVASLQRIFKKVVIHE